jgi:hypothetical protein
MRSNGVPDDGPVHVCKCGINVRDDHIIVAIRLHPAVPPGEVPTDGAPSRSGAEEEESWVAQSGEQTPPERSVADAPPVEDAAEDAQAISAAA